MYNTEQQSKLAEEVVSNCYVELAKYTTRTRSYPGLYDGMKSVYRRVLYQSRDYKKMVKSATLVGEALKLHPHGDSSIYSVLVEMTCAYGNFPLFDGKGNFGGLGFASASSRYTEAKLSDLARLIYLDLVDYAEFVESETGTMEPKYLPALIPYCFLSGSRGMSVGLPTTNIPPLNLMNLINFYIDYLEGNETEYPRPDFGNIIIDCDKEGYSDEMLKTGRGRLWFKPIITREDYNKFVVTEETPNSSFNKVIRALQSYIDDEVVDHIDETDHSGYRHVFITNNESKLHPDDLKDIINRALYCSVTYRLIVEKDSRAYFCNFDYIVKNQIEYLRECVVRKYRDYLEKINSRIIVLEAIQAVRANDEIMTNIGKMSSEELRKKICDLGYEDWVAREVLRRPISYLTKSYDNEINDLMEERSSYEDYENNPDKYLLELYRKLKSLVRDFYDSRNHSIMYSDLKKYENNKCSLSKSSAELVFGDDEDINWDSGILVVSKLGELFYNVVPKVINTPMELPDLEDPDDEYVDLAGDLKDYVVLITYPNYVSVIPSSRIGIGLGRYSKTWGLDSPVVKCFSVEGDRFELIDVRGNKFEMICDEWTRTRVSNPRRVSRYELSEYRNGDEVEKINS